jgi:phenylalanyl-tRNA synthetase beta chain
MKISYNWIKQFLKTDWDSEKTASLLTDLGLEVEGIEKYQSQKGGLKGIVVGQVITCQQHPNADKLKITTVDLGDGNPLQIVCGASNVEAGQKVLVATIGTILYDKEGKPFEIKKGKIRGEDSHGMICAEDEIGLGDSHEGIMVLDAKIASGTLASKVFNIEEDEVFEIGLTPNRADAMSHWGTARDLRAGMIQQGINVELITPSISNFNIKKRTLKIDVKVEDNKLVPRYCGVTISNITIKPSPDWLKNRLKAIGINPRNNVVDVTNYVLHELGQPLHAFDASKINGKIIVKHVPNGTKFTTLDDVERTLSIEDIMICDEKEPLCIAGVLGGKNSGVTENTTSIFLESAYFNPISVRKTAKRHGINTDASFRFERGIDPTIAEYALKRAAILICEVANGEITSDIIDVNTKKAENISVLLNLENVHKLIGQVIPDDTIKNILVSLDIKVNSISKVGLGLVIPPYRVDVTREIDVIEEILRIYGYNKIQFTQKLNASISNSSRTEDYKIQNIVANLLVGNGFNEMMANSLTTASYSTLSEKLNESNNVNIINPLSNELSTMRQSLLFSGLEAVSFNCNRKNNDLKLFEFGKTYHKLLSGYEENNHLTLLMSGNRTSESWATVQKPSDFFQFKGYILAILDRIGLTRIVVTPVENDVFFEGITYEMGNSTLVEFGAVKKSILKHFDIKQEVFFADFNWSAILKQISSNIKYTEISKYPEVRRDLALLIDDNVEFQQIFELVKKTEKSLLKEINLFDVYQGKNLPNGKKSYAISLILQDDSKTLTDVQIDKVMTKITHQLQTELGATLR